MKEKKLYTCEVCHTDYAEKHKCAECEKSHQTNLKIEDMVFQPLAVDMSGFPFRIKVISEDGEECTYYRKGRVK